MKPEKASLHALGASYGEAVLHAALAALHKKSNSAFSDEALFAFASQYEATSLSLRYEALATLARPEILPQAKT